MNVSEERKITAGTISGATFKSIDIEPSIIVDGKSYTASEFNKAVEMLKQPQLNENQQIVLDYLKKQFGKHSIFVKSIFDPISDLLSDIWIDDVDIAFEQLDLKQEIQVLEVFSQWVQEQEEE
ncbi:MULTISPECIES: hypothetical protein [unclassified Enterococcus]|uniref:hypothetical protein n=1 Tax=unclassified Enterococcus TaxID=2608891 RepID=UPI00259B3ACC|nr:MULTISPECIES: hypothetical protein [unclassified Enterococcus]MDO0919876.1 hypothetical protein [Enterococcus sp. B1E2]WIV14323.1 hypothetical protein QN079_10045 [Enterococcus sp. FZMF]